MNHKSNQKMVDILWVISMMKMSILCHLK